MDWAKTTARRVLGFGAPYIKVLTVRLILYHSALHLYMSILYPMVMSVLVHFPGEGHWVALWERRQPQEGSAGVPSAHHRRPPGPEQVWPGHQPAHAWWWFTCRLNICDPGLPHSTYGHWLLSATGHGCQMHQTLHWGEETVIWNE